MSNEIVEKVLKIIISSTRPMPAYFTRNGDREKSFCVDFDIHKDDEYEMASEVFHSVADYTEKGIGETLFTVRTKFAEDIMLGSYIITFLDHPEFIDDLNNKLINYNIESFSTIDRVEEMASTLTTKKYFEHCSQFGGELAVWRKTKKNKPKNYFNIIIERENKLTNN